VFNLARDLFVDGLGGGTDPLGLAILALALALGGYGALAWRQAGWKGAREAAIVLVPYLVWIAMGQNLSAQPRHALPIVVALAVALGLAATKGPRPAAALGVMLLALVLARTAHLAYLRRTIPPPGAQLVELVRGLPRPEKIAVFGGPSARFFAPTELSAHAQTAGSLGDALLGLGRADEMPERALVTSELAGLAESSFPLKHTATLCRPPRLDRRAPCLEVYDLRAPFLSRGLPSKEPTPPPPPPTDPPRSTTRRDPP
jgi:chromate transport protein ChrA